MENEQTQLQLIASRLRELRLISGKSTKEVASIIDVPEETYVKCESGESDFSFTFLHNCAKVFGVDITSLMTGDESRLSTFSVVRRGEGLPLERRKGFKYNHLASFFKGRMSEPFLVCARYSEEENQRPIVTASHEGEEFDYILSGSPKVNIDGHEEILNAGDAIYYNSSKPHGMIATGGEDCEFIAIVTDPHGRALEYSQPAAAEQKKITAATEKVPLVCDKYIVTEEDSEGRLLSIDFKNTERFNFAFDIIDEVAKKTPDKLALLHLSKDKTERRFSFSDISRLSSRAANYFKEIGIEKSDRVLLVMKRHWQFWPAILGLQKLGAIAIPATNQLLKKDYEYRFNTAGVSAIVCTADGEATNEVEKALPASPTVKTKISVNGKKDGWLDFDEFMNYSDVFPKTSEAVGGNDTLVMFFTSGTSGYPKIVVHACTYALGHYITARYWHNVEPDGLHLTISDTGWAKSMWGKLYGQWLCESAVFAYDFDRFDAADILPLFKKYNITTFCAPPTMYRFFIKENLAKYDLSSLKHATIAGEALNPEVFYQFLKHTGISLMEAFGQTETTMIIGNLTGMVPKVGSMGKPSPLYDADVMIEDENGKYRSCKVGEVGEIVIKTDKKVPVGLFKGYYDDNADDKIHKEQTYNTWHDGIFHTGDTAWKDEDGYYWYVGRTDDLIKSSGYRIGPFEIESVIMELPYVLEVAVTGAPDPIRGQVVKATIVPVKGTVCDDKLVKEIQNYVKTHTAPYKYPRIVEFVSELPKTISGKIRRVDIRNHDNAGSSGK